MKVIAIANQKGGVAKTTTTHNLGVALAAKGKRVLLLDLDGQASLTISVGLEPLKVLGVIATLYEKRVGDDNEILAALKKEYNLLGVIKRLAVAKKGIYDGLAVMEQTPDSEISIEYNVIADMMIADKYERERIEHE